VGRVVELSFICVQRGSFAVAHESDVLLLVEGGVVRVALFAGAEQKLVHTLLQF